MHTQKKTEHTPNWQLLASNIAERIKRDDPLALAELNQLCTWADKYTPAALGYDPTQQKETRAAAPDLLALAKHIETMSDDAYLIDHPEWIEIVNEARAAIARATGEEK